MGAAALRELARGAHYRWRTGEELPPIAGAAGAVTVLQSVASVEGSGTTIQAQLPAATTDGSTLVVGVHLYSQAGGADIPAMAATPITDGPATAPASAASGWQLIPSSVETSVAATYGERVQFYWAKNITGLATHFVQANMPVATYSYISVYELTPSVPDAVPATVGAGTDASVTGVDAGTLTPSVDGAVGLAAWDTNGTPAPSWVFDSGWTSILSGFAGSGGTAAGYLQQSVKGPLHFHAAPSSGGTDWQWVASGVVFIPAPTPYSAGHNANTAGNLTLAITLTRTVPVGDLLVLGLAATAAVTLFSGVSDTQGNVWVAGPTTSASGVRGQIFATVVTHQLTVADTVTVTSGAARVTVGDLLGFTGVVFTSATPDKTVSATGTGTAVSSGATPATSQASELAVGMVGVNLNSAPAFTAGAGWDRSPEGLIFSSAAARSVVLEWQTLIAAGAVTATGTLGTAPTDWLAMVATFPIGGTGPASMSSSESDTWTVSDGAASIVGQSRQAADAFTVTSSTGRGALGQARQESDSLPVSDAVNSTRGSPRQVADVVNIGDATGSSSGHPRAAADSFAMGDSSVAVAGRPRGTSDAFEVIDATLAGGPTQVFTGTFAGVAGGGLAGYSDQRP